MNKTLNFMSCTLVSTMMLNGASAPQLSMSFIAHQQGAVIIPPDSLSRGPKNSNSAYIDELTEYLKKTPPDLVKHLAPELKECSALFEHKTPLNAAMVLACANKLGIIIQLAQQTLYQKNLDQNPLYSQAQDWYYALVKNQSTLLRLLG